MKIAKLIYNGWEDTQDWDRDISEILEDIMEVHGKEFTGTIKVNIDYIPLKEDDTEDDIIE
jgi:hypothetical protein